MGVGYVLISKGRSRSVVHALRGSLPINDRKHHDCSDEDKFAKLSQREIF